MLHLIQPMSTGKQTGKCQSTQAESNATTFA